MTARDAGPIEAGTPLDLVLRLLDHQVLGHEQEMLGKVDDVALEDRDGRLVAVGVLCGPAGWAGRQPGALGRWGLAVWRRLDPRQDPRPLVLPLEHVEALGSSAHVDPGGEQVLAGSDGLELWLRRHVVSRIPGARGGGDDGPASASSAPRRHPELDLDPTSQLLSRLVGAEVVHHDGAPAGHVSEVRAEQLRPTRARVGPLVVVSLVHGPRRPGGRLGYLHDPRMGPWALGALVRWWHRRDVETPWAQVAEVDWDRRRVLLSAAAKPG